MSQFGQPFVDGLIAWWRLDGSAQDSHVYGYHGTLAGSPSFADGKIGQCLSMGSSSGQIITPIVDEDIPDTFTATAWVRVKQWGLSQGVFGTRASPNGFMLYRNSGDANGLLRTYLHYTNTSGTATTTSHQYTSFPLNQWFHVAVVRGHGYYKTYFNGVLVGHTVVSNFSHWNKGSTTFRIGAGGTSWQSPQIDIDDVRLYGRELSIKEIYDLSRGLILHYKFDDFQEPTENVVTNTDLDTGWSKGYCTGIQWNDIPPPLGVDSPVVSFYDANTDQSGYWYSYGDYAPQVPGETYTVSLYVKTIDSNFRIRFYTADNSETGRYTSEYITVPNDGNWHRVVWNSFINPSNSQSDSLSFQFNFGSPQGEGQRTWLCAPQMEAKPYATPFVKGSREGFVKDCSGYGNDAFLAPETTPQWTPGAKIGSGAYEFRSGSLNNIIADNVSGVSGQLTLSAWVFPTQYPSNLSTIIQGINPSSYYLSLANDGSLRSYWYQTTPEGYHFTPAGAVPLNQWSHVATTWDGSFNKLYVNGVLLKTTPVTGGGQRGTAVNIGAENLGRQFVGKIDDVRIYATALSEDDVKELYQQRASLDNHGNLYFTGELLESPVNACPPFSQWELTGGAYLDGDTLVLPQRSARAASPLIYIGEHNWRFSADFYSTDSPPDYPGEAGYYLDCSYYDIDGNPAQNTAGYTGNGHASRFPLNQWTRRSWGYYGGNDVRYLRMAIRNSSSYTGESYRARNPMVTVNGLWEKFFPYSTREVISFVPKNGLKTTGNIESIEVNEVGVTDGLIAWYPLSGNADDISKNGNHASVHGPIFTSAFKGSLGYEFDGVDDYILIPNFQYPASWNDPFSISLWMYVPSDAEWTNGYQGFIIARGTYVGVHGLGRDTTNNRVLMRARGSNTSAIAYGSVQRNTWHHLVGTWDGRTARLYVDGSLSQEHSANLEGEPTSGNWEIGRARAFSGASGNWFKGRLADIRIYNRPLSPQEVAILYKATKPSPTLVQQTPSGVYIAGRLIEV